jgi:hypothetical protein
MTTETTISQTIKNVVAGCIARKEWRASAEAAALAYAKKGDNKAVIKSYVKAEYDAAGAGFSGRWQ